MTALERLDWHGCYDERWTSGSDIWPEAFKHPAKFAPGLVKRIYRYGFERGWWRTGDVIGDPFGGVGNGGILAAYHGLRWVGMELEKRFWVYGQRSFRLHKRAWERAGLPCPALLRGDSRRFAEMVRASGVVTSPPYQDQVVRKRGIGNLTCGLTQGQHAFDAYGTTPGNIGNLPAGELDASVTSPPYAETRFDGGKTNDGSFGARPSGTRYGHSAGQIADLPLDASVTSPPWAAQSNLGGDTATRRQTGVSQQAQGYGQTHGQIGNSDGETYWQAMAAVYAQVHAALKPGGIMAVVVKDYVKAGKRVPLCDDTLRLLVSLGFEPVVRIRAWVTKSETTPGLFGDMTETTERKSFFRRLAEKNGSPRIDWEEVLVVKRA